MRDRSLDEFLDDGDDGPADEDGANDAVDGHEEGDEGARPAGGDDRSAAGPSDDDPRVEPAIRRVAPNRPPAESTFAFVPGGVPCAACGARVERRWRDDPGLVCGDCKEW